MRGSVFDQIQNEKLNAQRIVNKARDIPKTQLRRREWGANLGGPILQNKLFFFGNYEQSTSRADNGEPQRPQGLVAGRCVSSISAPTVPSAASISSASRAPTACRRRSDPFVAEQIQTVNASIRSGHGHLVAEPTA